MKWWVWIILVGASTAAWSDRDAAATSAAASELCFSQPETEMTDHLIAPDPASAAGPGVSIKITTSGSQTAYCAGALIDADWAVTAAHCVADAVDMWVTSRSEDERGIGQHQVDLALCPSGYAAGHTRDDVALLHLSSPMTGATPRLSLRDAPTPIGGAVSMVMAREIAETSGLRVSQVMDDDVIVTRNLSGPTNVCGGDSGAGLTAQGELIGVLSGVETGGGDACETHGRAYFAPITPHVNWITRALDGCVDASCDAPATRRARR